MSGNRAEERAMEANVLRKTISSDENTPEQNALLRSSYRATQLFYMGEKLDLVRQDLTRGNLRGIVNHLPPIVGRAARFIQGRP